MKILSQKLVFLLFLAFSGFSHADNFIIIANKELGSFELSKNEVKKIFTGGRTTMGEVKLVPMVLFGEESMPFYNFVEMPPTQFELFWVKKELSGDGKAPTKLATASKMIEKVSSTKGGIGFVPLSAGDSIGNDVIKVKITEK